MPTVLIECHGKRHGIQVAPMAPLSSAVTATLFAESIKADPAACRLLHGKKQLDLTTPWRFANLPSGAKLQLLTGQERRTGWGSSAVMSSAATSAASIVEPSTQALSDNGAPGDRQPSTTLPAADVAASSNDAPRQQLSPPHGAVAHLLTPAPVRSLPTVTSEQLPTSRTAANQTGSAIQGGYAPHPGALQNQAQTIDLQPHADPSTAGPTTAPDGHFESRCQHVRDLPLQAQQQEQQQQQEEQQEQEQEERPQHHISELSSLLGREAFVFSRQEALDAAAASNAAGAATEEMDSFFEFTAADYARVSRGWGSNMAKESASSTPLMTAKLRSAAAELAAACAPSIPVRIAFPDGMLLQGRFASGETLASIKAFVRAAMSPKSDFVLYTTPPKVVMMNASQTLLAAGFAPSAVVYATGTTGQPAPQLAANVLALQGLPPAASIFGGQRDQLRSQTDSQPMGHTQLSQTNTTSASGARQQSNEQKQRTTASGQKLPRWLKTGKTGS